MYRRTLSLALLIALVLWAAPAQAATTPSTMSYEGRLLDVSNNPVTTAIVLRLSLWKSVDWVSSDTSGGAINTGATNYGGWYETKAVTPNSNGNFQIQMGSSTALPTINFDQHKYLQVEVKSSSDPDTSYVLLDPTGDDGADAVDRKTISSVVYAKNAETVSNRTVGTASGNVLILGPNGRVQAAQMGSGTTTQTFTINTSNTAGDATLTFGNALSPATLKYAQSASRFEFSDDVLVQGNLTVGSGGTITASGSIVTEGGLTINKDNTAADATMTFGSSLGTKTLQYSTTNQRFEFNDDVSITGDLTVSGHINGVDFSAISPLAVSAGAGLTITVGSGSYRLGDTMVNYTGALSIAVAQSATNYVFFGSGGLTVRTAAFPDDESFIPLALVTTSATAVTSVADRRSLQSDTREHDVLTMLTPEFDKTAYRGDDSNNIGKLTMTQDTSTKQNYYIWTSSRPTLQDYDVLIRFLLPQDFVRWTTNGGANHFRVNYRSTSANATDNALDLSVYDTGGTQVTLSGSTTNLASLSWAETQMEFLGSPVWTPGQEITLKLQLSAKDRFQLHIGSIELHYTALTSKNDN